MGHFTITDDLKMLGSLVRPFGNCYMDKDLRFNNFNFKRFSQ